MMEVEGNVAPRYATCLENLIDEEILSSAWYGQQCDSTNTNALSDVRSISTGSLPPFPLPRLYLTDHQTGGRGRHGRTWLAPPGNLAFSVLIDTHDFTASALEMLSITAGVAVAQAIEFQNAPVSVRLKWPNDIVMDGGKIGGILLERSSAAAHMTVIGIGINVSATPDLSELAQRSLAPQIPQSLSQTTGRPVDAVATLDGITRQLLQWIDLLKEPTDSHLSEIIAEYDRRCSLNGHVVHFTQNGQNRAGTCRGIDATGALQVDCQEVRFRLTSGEVHRVRVTERLE